MKMGNALFEGHLTMEKKSKRIQGFNRNLSAKFYWMMYPYQFVPECPIVKFPSRHATLNLMEFLVLEFLDVQAQKLRGKLVFPFFAGDMMP